MRAMRRFRVASLVLAVCGTMLLVATPPPALGAVVLDKWGRIGAWAAETLRLDDTPRAVNIRCTIDRTDPNDPIPFVQVVNPPLLYARDRTAGVDTQKVGYKLTVQVRQDGTWVKAMSLATVKGTATDRTPATLANWPGGGRSDTTAARAILRLNWHRADGTVAGWVRIRMQYYDRDGDIETGACRV